MLEQVRLKQEQRDSMSFEDDDFLQMEALPDGEFLGVGFSLVKLGDL